MMNPASSEHFVLSVISPLFVPICSFIFARLAVSGQSSTRSSSLELRANLVNSSSHSLLLIEQAEHCALSKRMRPRTRQGTRQRARHRTRRRTRQRTRQRARHRGKERALEPSAVKCDREHQSPMVTAMELHPTI